MASVNAAVKVRKTNKKIKMKRYVSLININRAPIWNPVFLSVLFWKLTE
jgi:hypothetical protein